MKSKISKAHRAAVHATLERWANTFTNGVPNVEKAKECLRAAYTNGVGLCRSNKTKMAPITFYTVSSPVAFMMAMAIIRGRMNKHDAMATCAALGIDNSFIAPLRRDSLAKWNEQPRWWNPAKTEFSRTWLRAIREEYFTREQRAAQTKGIGTTTWANRTAVLQREDSVLQYRINSLELLVPTLRSLFNDATGLNSTIRQSRSWDGTVRNVTESDTEVKVSRFVNAAIPDSTNTREATGALHRAVEITDLLGDGVADSNGRLFMGNAPKAVDAEILCRILKLDDPAITWEFEVFHHCTTFASFQKSCVILADRPQVHVNEDGNLHNTAGPAVAWADGSKLWFNDGHFMDEGGRRIVEQPEQLSTEHIMRIRNEETRRLAIEKFGWDRFIAEADCPVIDRRRNDIDNTIEMLVGPPRVETARDEWLRRRQQNRMVLFCRSTGRRYFLGVPGDVNTCEAAQNWMADSGVETRLPYAKHPMRLLGAS